MSLKSLINDIGYISIDEVVNAIHQHIGLDEQIETAEAILIDILEKHIDENKGDITIYENEYKVWQPIDERIGGFQEIYTLKNGQTFYYKIDIIKKAIMSMRYHRNVPF
ncbi:hypothetical protein LU276_05940 [Moraxella haemolytica]|uniref:hypothetical protein n=1 Tax=Moraxella haemolytica TaxID=2904119 RepID=UPI0025426C08|nr:hypothetical protein [Moraxella sp. ZY171148]WII94572.1 hypothetical protein LU276_05940 [Moraxella sp. ZY171148]